MVLTAATEPSLWNGLSITTLAAGVLALVISALALRYTARAANAAATQTDLQRQISIDTAQPYVWADIRPDEVTGVLLYVVIANSGPTVATNVRVTFDPPLLAANRPERMQQITKQLAEGISSLPPGRSIRWSLDAGFSLNQIDGLISYTVTVKADGPAGALKPLQYVISLQDLEAASGRPAGSLKEISGAIEGLAKKLGK